MTSALSHLGWHDLSVRAADLDTGVDTRSVVGVDDRAAINLVCSHPTVVGTYRTEGQLW